MRHIAAWRTFADSHRCAVVAPLFPAMLQGPLDIVGYHYLGVGSMADGKMLERALKAQIAISSIHGTAPTTSRPIKHDLCLLAIMDEVALRWPGIDTSRVFLSGFSGGAQMVHRFLYLHPERVQAAAVASPGDVTMLDDTVLWPAGVKDWESVFGKALDLERLKAVPILAAVGGDDGIGKTAKAENEIRGMAPGAAVRPTRVQTLQKLAANWKERGLKVDEQVVPGVGHVMEEVQSVVEDFMAPLLGAWYKEDV